MKIIYLTLFLFLTFASFGQNKFIGKYTDILSVDTMSGEHSEALYYTTINIQRNKRFLYCYQMNSEVVGKGFRETVSGVWNIDGDTIVFKFEKEKKEPKREYFKNNNVDGIMIIGKDSENKQINFNVTGIDSCRYIETNRYNSIPF